MESAIGRLSALALASQDLRNLVDSRPVEHPAAIDVIIFSLVQILGSFQGFVDVE